MLSQTFPFVKKFFRIFLKFFFDFLPTVPVRDSLPSIRHLTQNVNSLFVQFEKYFYRVERFSEMSANAMEAASEAS